MMFFEDVFQFELDWLNKLAYLRQNGYNVIEKVEFEVLDEDNNLKVVDGE